MIITSSWMDHYSSRPADSTQEDTHERHTGSPCGRRLHRTRLGKFADRAPPKWLPHQDAVRQAGRPAEQRCHHADHDHRSAGRADDPQGFSRRPGGSAGVRHGGLRGHQGSPRPRSGRPEGHALGVHLPSAPVQLRCPGEARSTRSKSCARSWPRRPTRAAPRPSPGRCGKTTSATIPPACKASGAGSPKRTTSRS